MEDDSDDDPLSLNSPSSTGSRTPPPLCSPLSFRQLRTVPKKTNNDERQGNDAMGVQGGGADADGVMVGGGGFGIQDDHHELTHFPSLECVFLPGTRGLASAPFGIGFGCWRVRGRLCHACR